MADRTAHFDGVGPVRLDLIVSTTFPSGVLRLAYRPAPNEEDGAPGEPVTAAETTSRSRLGTPTVDLADVPARLDVVAV